MDEAQICENCGFERELNRGLCEGCEAERIATAPLLATIATLESRLAEVERERDEARAQRDGWHQKACEQAARATAAEARVKVLAASATDETEARHALRARIAELEGALRHIADGGVARDYGLGCGDNSCIQRRPTGMATNGGCRCDERSLRRHVQGVRRYARDRIKPTGKNEVDHE